MSVKPTDDGKFYLRENGNEHEVTKDELEDKASQAGSKITEIDPGHYALLERMRG